MHLSLLLQQGEVGQILLRYYCSLKAAGAKDSLELRRRRVRKAGKRMEDSLAWRKPAQDGHKSRKVFGQLGFCLVHCLLVWGSGLGVSGKDVVPLHLKES